jgi:hypothetical protein
MHAMCLDGEGFLIDQLHVLDAHSWIIQVHCPKGSEEEVAKCFVKDSLILPVQQDIFLPKQPSAAAVATWTS